jgi:phenylalanyl-tRNA synthetase beta chain
MKFTLAWLKDHLETDAPLAKITDALTNLGLEVEGVEDAGRKLAPFRSAEVISAEPHPNADKLRVCKVDTGSGVLQVVCGAPNARAGLKGVFAPVGTTIPATGIILTAATIRGVESNGMLCSERELELSEEHNGIIELPEDAPVGVPVAGLLGLDDPVIEIAITPNRGDCLGVHGVARDLAAAGIGRLASGAVEPVSAKGSSGGPKGLDIGLAIDPSAATACPLFAGRVVRGVKNGPSPAWLQKRLRAIGLRPINALVDITNYLCFDRARPLHVYDAAKITGTIRARLGRAGEHLTALDGKDYLIDETMCVIADDKGVLGLGGVMGGMKSGSAEATTDVFIESALFDPIRTASTGRALQILSDARYRFERGVDPNFVVPGLELATRMIMEICGGEPGAVQIAGKLPEPRGAIDFAPGDVARLTGLSLDGGDVAVILESLGFSLREVETPARPHFLVSAPSWRPDIHGPADLVEEVVRVAGLGRVPSTPLPPARAGKPVLSTGQKRARQTRRELAARGLAEAVTNSFVPAAHATLFGAEAPIRLLNPMSTDLDALRPSILPGLIAAAGRNAARGQGDVGLFEVGPVFTAATPGSQALVAAGIRQGMSRPRHWSGPAQAADAYAVKADVEAVLSLLGVSPQSIQISAGAPGWYHPGRSGTIKQGPKTVLAVFGALHPVVMEAFNVKTPLAGFEVFLDALPEPRARGKARPKLALPDLMPLERDFAFIADETVSGGDIVKAAREADRALITEVRLFDVFGGEALGAGKKSLAIAVRIQPRAKTLTDEEIEALGAKIIAAVAKATGAILRR